MAFENKPIREQQSATNEQRSSGNQGQNKFRFGNYDLVRRIDVGGMGEVYLARQRSVFDREVAIKILPEHLSAHSEALKRFRREGRAVAALSHPNIVALFDIGDSPEGPYVVTELLEGETLRARLTAAPITEVTVTDTVVGVVVDPATSSSWS